MEEPLPDDDRALRFLHLLRRAAVPLLTLVVVLAAVSVGTGVRDATVERDGGDRSVPATLLEPAGRVTAVGTVTATAVWPAPRGGSRIGRVAAPAGHDVGQDVSIWVDADGTPVRPAGLAAADTAGLTAGMIVLGVGGVLLAGLYAAAGRGSRRLRARLTDREWSAVEPVWSGRGS